MLDLLRLSDEEQVRSFGLQLADFLHVNFNPFLMMKVLLPIA